MSDVDAKTVTEESHPMTAMRRERPKADPSLEAQRARILGALFDKPTVQRFGRYIVLDVLGRGGMGLVFKGYDDKLDRQVAIKVLHEHLGERHILRLRREAQAMAKLSHPNVVQVFEVEEHKGQTFVVMEFVEGRTIRDWIGQDPRPGWKACVEVFLQLGAGLSAAHERGLVHRDFKPGNAIVDEEGRARVLDFGLARRGDERGEDGLDGVPEAVQRARTDEQQIAPLDVSLTKTGSMLGTPAYMSLEQMLGLEADVRSDQFGFCASLYEAVYGERPFEGSTLAGLLASLEKGVVRPAPSGSRVPARLRRILLRGLAQEPSERWPSMEVLLGELRRLVAPRGRTWVAGAGLVLGVTTVAAITMTWQQSGVIDEQGQQLTEKEERLQDKVVELEDEKRRVTRQLAAQQGLRAKDIAGDDGRAVEAVRIAVEAVVGLEPGEVMPADVFEGLTHAVSGIERGITLRGHENRVHAVTVSPDGSMLATASQDGTVRLWDADSGAARQTLEGHAGPVHAVAFSPDGTSLATGGDDQTMRVWEAATGRELESRAHQEPVRSVGFSPDGTRLAAASGDVAWVWHEGADAIIVPLIGHEGRVRSLAWSLDGTRVWTASEDHTVRAWDPGTGQASRTLEGHTDDVYDVAVSRDGTRIATGSRDETARLWDASTGEALATFDHAQVVYAVAWSPDDAELATGTFDDGAVRLLDVGTGRSRIVGRHEDAAMDVAFSPAGHWLVSASHDFTAVSWPLDSSPALTTLPHPRHVDAVALSPDGTRLATGSGDGTVRLWDPATGAERMTLKAHRIDVLTVAFSPDGTRLASGSWDGTVRTWDASSGAHLTTLRGHVEPVRAVVFSPDGTRIATASRDGTARVWDSATGEPLRSWSHEVALVDVHFTPDGRHVWVVTEDDRVRVHDVESGDALETLETPAEGPVTAVAWSADGTRVATGSKDGTVTVQDAAGRVVATARGHATGVRSMAWSPAGDRLATVGADGTVRVWDVESGNARAVLPHRRPVVDVSWSADGRQLATASTESMARLWSLEPEAWVQRGCAMLDTRHGSTPVTERACAGYGYEPERTAAGRSGHESAVVGATDVQTSETITVHGVELVRIPGGTFTMGSPAGERGRFDREGPQREVTLDDFYLARTPVTNAQYALYLESNRDGAKPSGWDDERFNQPEQPVVGLTWFEAKAYCDWAGLLLPTEAQWEYAARGGTTNAYWFGDEARDLPRFGWFDLDSGFRERGFDGGRARSVGARATNPLGLFDVHGNVFEWTMDAYGSYETSPRAGDGLAHQPGGGAARVVRGGGIRNTARSARSAFRVRLRPEERYVSLGFRPALSREASESRG